MQAQAAHDWFHAQRRIQLHRSDWFGTCPAATWIRSHQEAGGAVGRVPVMTPRATPPSDHLLVDRRPDGVAVLTLANPGQLKAMSEEMTASWVAAVERLADDRELRAVVVTGQGSAFCSGSPSP